MAVVRKKELRELGNEELKEKRKQLKTELSRELGSVSSGTKADNPGRIREMKRTIARINTMLHERGIE